jgi:hypothetical protein
MLLCCFEVETSCALYYSASRRVRKALCDAFRELGIDRRLDIRSGCKRACQLANGGDGDGWEGERGASPPRFKDHAPR